MIVALITTASVLGGLALANTWEEALNAHLGASLQDHQSHELCAEVAVGLQGSGSHRNLQYVLCLGCSQRNGSQVLKEGREGEQQCQAAILQPLPAAIYANVYELDNAAALGQGPRVKLFGPVDVESIEQYSKPTVLAIYLNISWPGIMIRGRPAAAAELPVPDEVAGISTLASASIPLHARYPRLVLEPERTRAAGGGGEGSTASVEVRAEKQAAARQSSPFLTPAALHRLFAKLAAGPVVKLAITQPTLLLRCGDGGLTPNTTSTGEPTCGNQQGDACSHGASSSASFGSWRQVKLCNDRQQQSPVWEIPTGDLSHADWVGPVTGAAVLFGALLVALSALRTGPGAAWF